MSISGDVLAAIHAAAGAAFAAHILLAYPCLPRVGPDIFTATAAALPAIALVALPGGTSTASRLTVAAAAALAALATLRTPQLLRYVVPFAAIASAGAGAAAGSALGLPQKWLLVAVAISLSVTRVVKAVIVLFRRRNYTVIRSASENIQDGSSEGLGTDAESLRRRKVPPNLRDASALTILYFHWIQPLVTAGRVRPLEIADIPLLADNLSSHFCSSNLFKPKWEEQVRIKKEQPSLWKALALAFGPRLFLGGILKVANDWYVKLFFLSGLVCCCLSYASHHRFVAVIVIAQSL